MELTTSYLVELVRAWSQGRTGRVPMPAGLDRDEFLTLLASHEVACALAPLLDEALLTPDVQRLVKDSCLRSSLLLLELERVLGVITTAQCRPVILKGAGLALNWYQSPQERWFVDLDLLVPRDQVLPTCERLLDLGYRYFGDGVDLDYYDNFHLHRIMVSPQNVFVEVHWALTVPYSVYSFDLQGVFERALDLQVGRQPARVASAVDQVLHGVYQHIADGFKDIKRLLDLVVLLKDFRDEDWLYLVKESRQTRMAVALGQALSAYQNIVGLEVPAAVLEQLTPGPVTGRILRGLNLPQVCLARQTSKEPTFTILLHLLMIPETQVRLRELGRFFWPREIMTSYGMHHPQPLEGIFRRFKLGFYYFRNLARLSARVIRAYASG